MIASAFFALLTASLVLGFSPEWVLWLYAAMSLLTVCVYAIDKSAACKGQWRIPEKTLHIMSLLGGWPGALCAQRFLRHKTSKQPFRLIFWLTVAANTGVLIYFSR